MIHFLAPCYVCYYIIATLLSRVAYKVKRVKVVNITILYYGKLGGLSELFSTFF